MYSVFQILNIFSVSHRLSLTVWFWFTVSLPTLASSCFSPSHHLIISPSGSNHRLTVSRQQRALKIIYSLKYQHLFPWKASRWWFGSEFWCLNFQFLNFWFVNFRFLNFITLIVSMFVRASCESWTEVLFSSSMLNFSVVSAAKGDSNCKGRRPVGGWRESGRWNQVCRGSI